MNAILKTGLLGGALLFAIPATAQEAVPLETPAQQYSYAIGQQIGGSVKSGEIPGLSVDAVMLGLRDALTGAESKLTDEQIAAAMTEFQNTMQAAAVAAAQEKLEAGRTFLEQNKTAEGVTTTESGLQYKIETAGEGANPTAQDTVSVHYEGRLLDGTVFDSSLQRGQPATFGVGQVIPGWTEALQLMVPGAKWQVWIPSELAYGERGAGEDIGPHEVLNFTIELLEIK